MTYSKDSQAALDLTVTDPIPFPNGATQFRLIHSWDLTPTEQSHLEIYTLKDLELAAYLNNIHANRYLQFKYQKILFNPQYLTHSYHWILDLAVRQSQQVYYTARNPKLKVLVSLRKLKGADLAVALVKLVPDYS